MAPEKQENKQTTHKKETKEEKAPPYPPKLLPATSPHCVFYGSNCIAFSAPNLAMQPCLFFSRKHPAVSCKTKTAITRIRPYFHCGFTTLKDIQLISESEVGRISKGIVDIFQCQAQYIICVEHCQAKNKYF